MPSSKSFYDELPRTYTVETPSGGSHRYYSVPRTIATRKPWRPGIDILCSTGQAVAPGSTLPHGVYRVIDDARIAPCPEWLLEMFEEAKPAAAVEQEPIAGTWTDADQERVIRWLRDEAPLAIERQHGDDTTLHVLRRAKDLGVPDVATMRELFAGYYNPRCQPPWDERDIDRLSRSAFRNATNQPGSGSPSADFKPIDPPPAVTPADRFPTMSFAEFKPKLDQIWLVDETLPMHGVFMLYGPPYVGKTFLGVDLCLSIARGVPWLGQRTEQGATLYVSTEGDLANVIAAYREHHGLAGQRVPFDAIEAAVNLYANDVDLKKLVNNAADLAQKYSTPVRTIMLDTTVNVIAGGDINVQKDVSVLMRNAARLYRETGAAIGLVHHEGKTEGRGAAGSFVFNARVESMLRVEEGLVEAEKVRGARGGCKHGFDLKAVDLGVNPKTLKSVTSCVVVSADVGKQRPPLRSGGNAELALEALTLALNEEGAEPPASLGAAVGFVGRVATEGQWRDRFAAAYLRRRPDLLSGVAAPDSREAKRAVSNAFKPAERECLEKGYIEIAQGYVWLK